MQNSESLVYFVKSNTKAEPYPGETISALARRTGIYIDSPCGDNGLCGKCGVQIMGVAAPEPTGRERGVFSEAELKLGFRLSCQHEALPGMQIVVPDSDLASAQILGSAEEPLSLSGRDRSGPLGIAIDIGTTTIVMYLINKKHKITLAVSSAVNPQVSFDADVIARISYASESAEGLNTLQRCIIDQLNLMIADVLKKGEASRDDIDSMIVAGNTTMEHIFAGVSPASIGMAPFSPQFYSSLSFKPSELGIELNDSALIRLLPNISGFVGGDIVSGIIYSEITKSDAISLLVDIGTNNEMLIGNKDFIVCCSAAAGPALEGAKISSGMRAASGAIDCVALENGDLKITTIGNSVPRGVCGSGLVDAVSVLLSSGVLESSGKFAETEAISNPALAERLKAAKGARRSAVSFRLNSQQESEEVSLTQKDIREVQLAKGAIATGVELMLEDIGKSLSDVDRVFLAGAFGNYINIKNAKRLGILPNVADEKIIPIGNSSGLGACKIMYNDDLWAEAEEILKMSRHIELATHPHFQDKFIKNLSF